MHGTLRYEYRVQASGEIISDEDLGTIVFDDTGPMLSSTLARTLRRFRERVAETPRGSQRYEHKLILIVEG